MGTVIFSISMSLDGFVTGPNDRPGQGLGEGGEILHHWVYEEDLGELFGDTGACVVGWRTFDVSGWGDNPPLGLPCFVLTHQVPQEWAEPGSAFTFVTDGIESAVAQAQKVAGDRIVGIGGGADIGRQALEAGLVDEIHIQLAPVLLGAGIRLFEHLEAAPIRLERTRVIESRHATHLRFTVLGRP
jgi:dihydrofolate reductase